MGKFTSSLGKFLEKSLGIEPESNTLNTGAMLGLQAFKMVDQYLKGAIPEKIDEAIETRIKKTLSDLKLDWDHLVKKINLISILLMITALVSCGLTQVEWTISSISVVFLIISYALPVLIVASIVAGIIFGFSRLGLLEGEIKKSIEQGITESGAVESTLVHLYENRSVEKLAEMAAGKTIFGLLHSVRSNRKTWIWPVLCIAISYGCALAAHRGG